MLTRLKLNKGYLVFSLLGFFLFCFLAAFVSGSMFFSVGDSSAESTEVDIIARVHDVLSITTDASNDELPLNVTPTPSGTLTKNQLTVTVSTNNSTGYTLNMNSITTNTSMVHESATGSPPAPNIPSTTHDYTTPATLGIDTWGWNLGTASSTTTFKKIPPSGDGQTIRTTDAPSSAPSPDSDTIVTFGANVTDTTVAGAYINTMVFTATTNYVPIATPCETGDYECILFTINTTDGTYSIPTSGLVADMHHTYNWDVYVDGILTTACPGGNCTGTSHSNTAPGVNGIALTGLSNGEHQIKIVPHNGPAPGWGNAFGHAFITVGANVQANKNKLISLDSPLTTMAFAPKTTESTTNASYMFANIFINCVNLTEPATFVDTYKLPSAVTDFSFFLSQIHHSNTNLTTSIDLTPLAGWLSANNSINNLDRFLNQSHDSNPNLGTPINLGPLAGWFNNNTSITSMYYFLASSHFGNTNLTIPIDLTPLSGWFNANTSIANLACFLGFTHYGNTSLTAPINLVPLSGWFNANRSFTNLASFLEGSHYSNNDLTLAGQTIFPNWIKTATQGGTSIWNVSNAFYQTFYAYKFGDTGEPRFQDGSVLSSIGTPATNNQAYIGRYGITPVNTNWQ